MPDVNTENGVLARLAAQAATPARVESPAEPYVVHNPEGAHTDVLDLERFLPAPRRKTGTYNPADVNAFTEYVANHADAEHTTIWVDQINAQIVAVLNDNAKDAPAWRDHRAALALLRTPEWKHWLDKDGRWMSQEDFAEHIQDGLLEIREPDAADMLEIAQTFQGKTAVEWKSGTRIDNGQVSFQYTEEVEATAGRTGNLAIPQEIVLGVAPFYGEQPFEVHARLRYRVKEGSLTLSYRLERPKDVELLVLKGIAQRLADAGNLGRVYMGTPA